MNVTIPSWQSTATDTHRMPSSGAFSAVHARRTFDRPAQQSPITPSVSTTTGNSPAAEKAKRDWPDSVRSYVQRAFATENNVPELSRHDMELKLKEVISHSAESNTLNTVDWATLPLPQHMILNERAQSARILANPPWGNGLVPLNLHETNTKANGMSSKKRKSSELEPSRGSQDRIPPWRVTNDHTVLEDRVSYPDKRQRNEGAPKGSSKSQNNQSNRKKRFDNNQSSQVSNQLYDKLQSPVPEMDQGPVIGRSQDLEKKYFRLTSAPNPDTVRPLPVLERTLDLLKKKWKKDSNYSYICDQFKSLRQDLTVQHIKTGFTVNVYELHARIALEKGDLGEYNQCQTQLRALYSQQLGGHPEEFKAYRILYFIHTCNRTDMNDVLSDLTPAEKQYPAIKHALNARSALALGNYHRFFQLYLETPNMGAYLMDMFVGRERLVALSNICISYKPDLKLRFVTEELGFESDDESARFICDLGGQAFLDEREEGEVRLLTGKALRFFEAAKAAAFKKVDIKGQI